MLGIISVIGDWISNTIVKVGPAIGAAVSALVTKLPNIIISAKIVVDTISTVVSKVAESLGIAPKDENPEELGVKAIQDGTRPKMNTETTQEYLDYLRKDVQLDREKYEKMSIEEKVACNALGTTMVSKSIEEKTGVELPPEFLMTVYKSKLRFEQVERFINTFADRGISSMGDFTKYITNDLSEGQAEKVGRIIKDSIKELSPTMTEEEIMQKVVDMKRSYNGLD